MKNGVFCSPIIVTLMMEALSSYEKSVLTRGPRRNITEDAILQLASLFKYPGSMSYKTLHPSYIVTQLTAGEEKFTDSLPRPQIVGQ
jgi:hypothetical protein